MPRSTCSSTAFSQSMSPRRGGRSPSFLRDTLYYKNARFYKCLISISKGERSRRCFTDGGHTMSRIAKTLHICAWFVKLTPITFSFRQSEKWHISNHSSASHRLEEKRQAAIANVHTASSILPGKQPFFSIRLIVLLAIGDAFRLQRKKERQSLTKTHVFRNISVLIDILVTFY